MQNIIHALAGIAAMLRIPDIPLDKAEAVPLIRRHQGLDLFQVMAVTGGKVVQPHDGLIPFQKGFGQIGADETGSAGYQPGFWILGLEVHGFRVPGSRDAEMPEIVRTGVWEEGNAGRMTWRGKGPDGGWLKYRHFRILENWSWKKLGVLS